MENINTDMVALLKLQEILEASWEVSDPISRGLYDYNSLLPKHFAYSSAETQDRRDGNYPPVYRTYPELQRMWEAARWLASSNSIIKNLFNHYETYVVGSGFEYQVVAKDGGSERLVKAAQKVLDQFHDENMWNEWEQELVIRCERDGEYALRFMDAGFGMLRVRTVEPEQIREPQDISARNSDLGLNAKTASWTYGVHSDKYDSMNVHGYWVLSQYTDRYYMGEYVPIEDLQHVKINVDRTAKRGVSSLFSVADDAEEIRKLLRNLRKGAANQAAIAWIREHAPGTSASQVEELKSALADRIYSRANGSSEDVTGNSGRRITEVNYDAGTVLDVKHGQQYKAGPLTENGPLLEALQAALRNLGNAWGFPEGLSSGDWSNNNFASALVAEGPMVKRVLKAQMFFKSRWVKVMMRALQHAQMEGVFRGLGGDISEALEIVVTPPNAAIRDRVKEVEADLKLVEAGIMSKKTCSGKHDLDYDLEQAQIETEPEMEEEGQEEPSEDSVPSETQN